MKACAARLLLVGLCAGLLCGMGGCVSSEQSKSEQSQPPPGPDLIGPDLAAPDDAVKTIQLYRGDDEQSLPIADLENGTPLTLEFDLLTSSGRPLTVQFVHADRTWERDLSPGQALQSYRDDTLVDYQSSRGTKVEYTHYTYRFPNDDIQFQVSGNYILRVTEQGRRDAVLFEQPFYVAETEGTLQTGAEPLPSPGQSQPSVRLVARYDPPQSLRGDPFGYTACFIRNGRLGESRCQGRPRVAQQPRLAFEQERRQAFEPVTADHTVDLRDLRTSSSIERTDRVASPTRVLLEPDYARFSGGAPDLLLTGQTVVRESNRATPALTADYVRTTFAFVPPGEGPVTGGVTVAGSFSGMDPARGTAMRWRPDRKRYEGAVLLKQGLHQYFYQIEDPDIRDRLRRNQSVQRRNVYTTLIYYQDPSQGTDRLLRVQRLTR